MRKLAPILVFAIVVAGFYWALGGPLAEKAGGSGKLTPAADAASRPASRSAPAASRPTSRNLLPSAESEPAESRPESSPASQPATLPVVIIEVVREDGRPIANAMLHADIEGGLGGSTDESGRAEIAARPGVTVWMSVRGNEFLRIEREVSLDSGTRRIIVPTGSVVAGRVTVSGQPPDEPILVTLTRRGLLQAAFRDGRLALDLGAFCDADGKFEFFNLPPDWQGRLGVSTWYEIADRPPTPPDASDESDDESRSIELSGPNPAVELKLVPLPAIKGRLVRSERKDPVSGMGHLVLDGSHTTQSHFGADSDGRFRILVEPEVMDATLVVSDSIELGTRSIPLQGPFTGVRDLGDVEIGPTRRVRFRVHDAESRPVKGAYAEVEGARSRSDPTDDEGASSIQADTGPGAIRIAKLGYTTKTVALPENDAVLEVELAAGNTLVIDIRLSDGSIPDASFLEVCLSSAAPMFAGDRWQPEPLLNLTGASEAIDVGHEVIRCNTGQQGRIVLGGFAPGATIRIQLRGINLGELLDESFVVMDAAGTKSITLRTQSMPLVFAGVVQGRDGSPVHASVFLKHILADSDRGDYEITDELGRFRAMGLFTPILESVMITALTAEGFIPLRLRNVTVSDVGQVFTLDRGLTVRIDIVDEASRPIRNNVVELSVRFPELPDDEQPNDVQPVDNLNQWIARGLPDGIVEITATVGTAHVGIRHDARIPVARLVIPSTGGAEIHWTRNRRDPASCRIRVESVPPGAEVFVAVPDEVTDHYLEAQLSPGTWRATALGFDEQAGDWVVLGSSRPFAIRLYEGTAVEVAR